MTSALNKALIEHHKCWCKWLIVQYTGTRLKDYIILK